MKSFMRVSVVASLTALSLCLVGCEEKQEQQAAAAPPPPAVETLIVYETDVPWESDYVAQTAGSRSVEVRAQVSGIVKERTYIEGTLVKQGELLFQIEDDAMIAAKNQAESDLAQAVVAFKRAEIEHARILRLYKQGAVSQSARDDAIASYGTAKAAVAAAQAGLDVAKVNLAYTKVIAPVDGISSKESRSEGSLVTAVSDNLLTTITQVNPLYVNFGIPYTEDARQRALLASGKLIMAPEGLTVALLLADGSQYESLGLISFRDSTINQNSATVQVRAEVENENMALFPGQFVRAIVRGYAFKDSILIPQRAVLETQQGSMVYVIDEQGVANLRPVKIYQYIGNDYLVEGLKDGEQIILEGIIKARPGQPVTVTKTTDSKSTEQADA